MESAIEVSPSANSSQRLWTFLVPGLTPQEANESEGKRGLSHSERDCGVVKLWLWWVLRVRGGRDMVEILRNRRGREGKGKEQDFEGKRKQQMERAVRKRSGRVVMWRFVIG
jgi:hypothetical protein